jgi:dihydrofolate synthase / folylpolyglutamate synthase
MTYSETVDFLFSRLPAYHRIGKAAYKNNLSNINALDEYFNHPHEKYRTIHVGGTNGKGSVSHMIASVFQEAGYKTGLYTSPHLRDFRERIKINGEMIEEEEVIRFVTDHREIINKVSPSFFELTVALAFDYFARSLVDVAIIEVGLGGRLDSTNIINPVLSVITNIGHDHMDLLGNTLGRVAVEKAGIIKDKVPVVISETHPETKEVFISAAQICNSDISFADELYDCRLEPPSEISGERKYIISDRSGMKHKDGITVLGGDYQSANLKAVFAVFEKLQGDFVFTNMHVTDGIRNVVSNTGLLGRWQIIGKNPLTICDTGHNREGLEYNINQLRNLDAPALHIIIGFVNDKDLDSVLPLFPKNAEYYFTQASIERALDPELLRQSAKKYGLEGLTYSDVRGALKAARERAGSDDVIFIGGSTFVVGEVL